MAAAFIPKGAAKLRKRLRDDFGPEFHWSEIADVDHRLSFLALLVELDIDLRAIVARNVLGRAQETTGRARCFGALITDLAAAGGRKLTIDKRETDDKNKRDTAQIDGFIQRAVLPSDFQHSFKKPPAEPIIWIADAVAGAVQSQVTHGDSQYIEAVVAQLRLRVLP